MSPHAHIRSLPSEVAHAALGAALQEGRMIMITTQHQDHLVEFAVFGEFTLADFKELEELVLYEIKFSGPVNLLVDLSDMADFTLDVAWEEIRFSKQHAGDFKRIAVVTDSQWVAWSAWLSQLFVNADVTVFDNEPEARSWLAEVGA